MQLSRANPGNPASGFINKQNLNVVRVIGRSSQPALSSGDPVIQRCHRFFGLTIREDRYRA